MVEVLIKVTEGALARPKLTKKRTGRSICKQPK